MARYTLDNHFGLDPTAFQAIEYALRALDPDNIDHYAETKSVSYTLEADASERAARRERVKERAALIAETQVTPEKINGTTWQYDDRLPRVNNVYNFLLWHGEATAAEIAKAVKSDSHGVSRALYRLRTKEHIFARDDEGSKIKRSIYRANPDKPYVITPTCNVFWNR